MRYRKGRKKAEVTSNTGETITKAISDNLRENLDDLHRLLDRCSDVVFKEFSFGPQGENRGLMVFFDGLVNKEEIEFHLLKSLMLKLNAPTNGLAFLLVTFSRLLF